MGIGKAIAKRYAEAGASLVLVDRDETKLSAVCEEIRAQYGVDVQDYVVDLAAPEQIDQFWQIFDHAPDVLMNNAGVFMARDFTDSDDEFVAREMQVNFGAVRQMCREMIVRRGKKGGVIINVSSIEAKLPFKADLSIYSVSKAAVSALTRSLAREYAAEGFKINAIVPGGIMTEGFKQVGVRALKKFDLGVIKDSVNFSARLPIKHYGRPDDIARAALYLAAPISDYIQGSEIVCDGGFLSN